MDGWMEVMEGDARKEQSDSATVTLLLCFTGTNADPVNRG